MTPTFPGMLLTGFTPRIPPKAGKHLFSLVASVLRVWSCSPSVHQQRQKHASVSSRKFEEFLRSMHCTKLSSSALTESGVALRNRNSTFATQNRLGPCVVGDSKKKLFFHVFLSPNSTVPRVHCSHCSYACDSTIQCLSRSWRLRSTTRPLSAYPDFANSNCVSCRVSDQDCSTIYFNRLTNI